MGKRERRSCHYCGVGMTKRGTKEPRSATVDHIIPKSRGGTSSPINIVMCCRRCNNEKGNFTGVEYRAWIEAGRPQREVFKSKLPHFEHYYTAEDGSHFEWFKRLYIDKPDTGGCDVKPTLIELLKAAASREMTPAEIESQRQSWVRGMTTGCEHGILDYEQCPDCNRSRGQGVRDA